MGRTTGKIDVHINDFIKGVTLVQQRRYVLGRGFSGIRCRGILVDELVELVICIHVDQCGDTTIGGTGSQSDQNLTFFTHLFGDFDMLFISDTSRNNADNGFRDAQLGFFTGLSVVFMINDDRNVDEVQIVDQEINQDITDVKNSYLTPGA